MNILNFSERREELQIIKLVQAGNEKLISKGVLLAVALAMAGCGGIEEKSQIAKTNVVDKVKPVAPVSSAPEVFEDVPVDQWESDYVPKIPADIAEGEIDDDNPVYHPDAGL